MDLSNLIVQAQPWQWIALLGVAIGIVGGTDFGPTDSPVMSGVGYINETVVADVDTRRMASFAARLEATAPVSDAMLADALTAVAARAADGDVRAIGLLMEIARIQRAQKADG